jgi:hypothetical protein
MTGWRKRQIGANMKTYEDDEFERIEREQGLREKALQKLHDENVRLGLYDDAYGIPFVDRDEFHRLLKEEL